MTGSILTWLKVILAGVALAAACSVVWKAARAPLLVELAQQNDAHTREKLRTFERAAQVLQAAQDLGDQLTITLETRQGQINQLAREKRDAIAKATTGRTCLGGAALRLLNSAPGLSVGGLTTATGSAVATGATTATDPNDEETVSTDTDIATWAVDAGAQYEVCRTRLDALIDWHIQPATSHY